MKKLIPLLLLTSVIACGKKDNGKNRSMELIRQGQEAMTANTVRGMVMITTSETTPTSGDFAGERESKESKDIVLKISGSKVYTLEEETNKLTGSVTRKVVLDDTSASDAEDEKYMKQVNVQLTPDYLYITGVMTETRNYDQNTLSLSFNVYSKRGITRPCEGEFRMDLRAVLTRPGEASAVSTSESRGTAVCGATLTSQQLKDLDLSSITFCEEQNDEETCRSHQNMEDLTADL